MKSCWIKKIRDFVTCKTSSKVRCTRASFYIHSKLQKRKRKLCLLSCSYVVFYYFNSNYFIYKNAQNKAFRKLLYIFEWMILEFLYIPHRFKYINKAFLKKISKEKISFYNLKKGFSIRNIKLFYLDQCIKGNIRCETFHQSGKFLIISYINKLTTNPTVKSIK